MNNMKLIENAKRSALAGNILDRESFISLLNIDPYSKEAEVLGETAREVASIVCKDKAYLWAAIGLDYKYCSMNCHFCSFGQSWGLIKGENELGDDEVLELVRRYAGEGARWIVLRTTQFYSLEKLSQLTRKIRDKVPGDYEMVINAGEFNKNMADRLAQAGISAVYHSVRLGEGKDTKFTFEARLATLEAINNSPLNLVFLVEPIGGEHSNGEIADTFFTAMKYKAMVTGAMARVPVQGTPLGDLPMLSATRLAQITAAIRLAAGYEVPNICVHPASELAIKWGANVTVVETGAVPRDLCFSKGSEWNRFDIRAAKKWFNAYGYTVFQSED